MQKIVPCLCFKNEGEEAVKFYTSIFKNSSIQYVSYYPDSIPSLKGSVMAIQFTLEGQEFVALNGPDFKFTEAISFYVNCNTQKELDRYWEKLSKGGKKGPCGWLKDKYGISWQIVPSMIQKLISNKDARKVSRVMQAVMKMKKLDIDKLKRAYNQK